MGRFWLYIANTFGLIVLVLLAWWLFDTFLL